MFKLTNNHLFSAFICLASVALWYCLNTCYDFKQTKSAALTIVCTTGMIADAVRAVGGPQVQVTTLMGPGIDPHLYRACEGDVHRLACADIVFYNGLHLEGKMASLLAQMGDSTYAVADSIPRHLLRVPAGCDDGFDPHVWLDVSLWIYIVPYVRDILSKHDPEHGAFYATRAIDYLNRLQQLDQYVRSRVALLRAERRMLVTAHDAFYYFGTAYGFQVVGLQGISTESQAGIKDIRNLVDFLVAQNIPAIFVESSISQRSLQAVQAAAHARGFNVAIGPELFSDALGQHGTPQGTYVGMIEHNIDAMVTALSQ